MATSAELLAARAALSDLTRAIDGLRARYGETPELRSLARDLRRFAEDLDDVAPAVSQPGVPPALEIVPDVEYRPHDFTDCDDEGLGFPGRELRSRGRPSH
jgi:hypothetical protein